MSKNLITIYTPVYNGEKFISETIESVLSQSYHNFEYLIIDDGSNDKTGAILDSYAEKDPRIRIIFQSNKGVSTASNVAIMNAKGKYCLRIDVDDICLPGRFATQYEFMEQNPKVVVSSGLMVLFGYSKKVVSYYG